MFLNTETMLSPLPEVRDRAEEENNVFSFSLYLLMRHQLLRTNIKGNVWQPVEENLYFNAESKNVS